MDWGKAILGRTTMRRALALVVFAALLYFAAGGAAFHQHANGSEEAACPICQALHMPALAAARLDLSSALEMVTWHSALPQHAAPSASFSLHRASRAPPTA
jgi:hypothetical protein